MTRRASRLRAAFERATEGAAKELAYAAFPDVALPTAQGKVHRALAADGDLNAPWALLDAVAEHNPFPLLDALCELAGCRWERIPETAERATARILERQAAIGEQLELLREDFDALRQVQARDRKPPIRVGASERRRESA